MIERSRSHMNALEPQNRNPLRQVIKRQQQQQQAVATMFRRLPTFLLLLAALATTMPNSVEARYTASYKAKGVGAYADAIVDDGCNYGYVFIDGVSAALKQKTSEIKPTTTYNKYTYVSYSITNYCTGEFAEGFGEVYPSTFAGDKNGATASATITTTCYWKFNEEGGFWDYVCEPAPFVLTIDATWVATGSTFKDRSTSSYGNKLFSYKSRSSGTAREATITLEVTKDGEALNVDPSSIWGKVYTAMEGSKEVVRYEY